jgi:hypothetical protein
MRKYIILALLDGGKVAFTAVGKNKKAIIKHFIDTYKKNNLILLIIKRIKNREYLLVQGLGESE